MLNRCTDDEWNWRAFIESKTEHYSHIVHVNMCWQYNVLGLPCRREDQSLTFPPLSWSVVERMKMPKLLDGVAKGIRTLAL